VATIAESPPWSMTVDLERLREALNLGWSVAELRGRLRYGHVKPPGSLDYPFARDPRLALPMAAERSDIEQQIAARNAVSLLARRLGLDEVLPKRAETASATIRTLALNLEVALAEAERNGHRVTRVDTYPPESAVGKAWASTAEAIYYWDALIQDGLGVSATLLAAYRLGRGLSEAFWALNPDAPPGPESIATPPDPTTWEFLLGQGRRRILSSCLERLEASLPPLTRPAIEGPLSRWCWLVKEGQVRNRSEEAMVALRTQLQIWREVLIEARDPGSFAAFTPARLRLKRSFGFVLAMLPAVLLAAVGVALLTVAGYFFGSSTVSIGTAVLVAVVGTVTGLLGTARLRDSRDAERRRIVEARATILPRGVWVSAGRTRETSY
jgi:hypothetical protein